MLGSGRAGPCMVQVLWDLLLQSVGPTGCCCQGNSPGSRLQKWGWVCGAEDPSWAQGISCSTGHRVVQCWGGSSCPPSPHRSEEPFAPHVLPGQVVLFSHLRLWGQTCSNFSCSHNESVRGHSLLNAVLLDGGLLEISVPQVGVQLPRQRAPTQSCRTAGERSLKLVGS